MTTKAHLPDLMASFDVRGRCLTRITSSFRHPPPRICNPSLWRPVRIPCTLPSGLHHHTDWQRKQRMGMLDILSLEGTLCSLNLGSIQSRSSRGRGVDKLNLQIVDCWVEPGCRASFPLPRPPRPPERDRGRRKSRRRELRLLCEWCVQLALPEDWMVQVRVDLPASTDPSAPWLAARFDVL